MNAASVTGQETNNNKFSKCSKYEIGVVLKKRMAACLKAEGGRYVLVESRLSIRVAKVALISPLSMWNLSLYLMIESLNVPSLWRYEPSRVLKEQNPTNRFLTALWVSLSFSHWKTLKNLKSCQEKCHKKVISTEASIADYVTPPITNYSTHY